MFFCTVLLFSFFLVLICFAISFFLSPFIAFSPSLFVCQSLSIYILLHLSPLSPSLLSLYIDTFFSLLLYFPLSLCVSLSLPFFITLWLSLYLSLSLLLPLSLFIFCVFPITLCINLSVCLSVYHCNDISLSLSFLSLLHPLFYSPPILPRRPLRAEVLFCIRVEESCKEWIYELSVNRS